MYNFNQQQQQQTYSPFSMDQMFNYPVPPPPPPMVPFDRDISPPRKRTRTTPEQLAVLEKSFSENPSPNNRVREQLSIQLGISERSIQIWFQNRRAKVKNQAKKNSQNQDTMYLRQQYAASAAAAACQTAALEQNQTTIDPNLYYYYYYYYFQQQQQQTREPPTTSMLANPTWSHSMPDLSLSASTSSSSITSDQHFHRHHRAERTRAHSVGPYPYYQRSTTPHERQSSLGPPSSNTPPAVQPFLLGSDSRLYNSSTILEEPYPITQEKFNYSVSSLQIGTWKRVSDVQCQIDMTTRTFTWLLSDDHQNFRIDIPLSNIQYIRMTQNVEFYINDPTQLQFFMTVQGQWVQCHDFTQDKQATIEHLHVLEGSHQEFKELLMQSPDLQSLLVHHQNMLLLQGIHLPQQ